MTKWNIFCAFTHGWLDTDGESTMLLSQLTALSPKTKLYCVWIIIFSFFWNSCY